MKVHAFPIDDNAQPAGNAAHAGTLNDSDLPASITAPEILPVRHPRRTHSSKNNLTLRDFRKFYRLQ